jgi:hypothetical protein
MTSTRRTNLYKITAYRGVQYPVLSVGLTDLAESTVEVFAEIRDDFRIVGNGTFKPSFGEGIPTPVILTSGEYSLHFCMDTQTRSSRVRDHTIIRGASNFINQTTISISDRSL